ncbi:DNA binding domain-containing protein [Mycobacterium tuberculosis]|nr:DNA binding domain-containing protein [Mycobacterium tuberculosis]
MADKPTINCANRRNPKQAEQNRVIRRWASMNQGAEYAGVGLRTLREWISQGKITGYRMNARVIRVDLNEIDAAFQPFGGAA